MGVDLGFWWFGGGLVVTVITVRACCIWSCGAAVCECVVECGVVGMSVHILSFMTRRNSREQTQIGTRHMETIDRRLRSLDETRQQLPISMSKLHRLMRAGELTRVKIGARAFVTQQSIDDYVDRLEAAAK